MTVMGAKFTTKTYGERTGVTGAADLNPSQDNNLSAEDFKNLGADSVGEVANKLSDPNWVDPTKKIRTVGKNELDKDAFFKLMITQMKNQDPTNPLKSHEMAAQLANFSSLEQMQNMNTTLTDLKNAQKPSENYQVLNLIGKAISGDSSQIVRTKGDKEHDFRFDLPQDGKEVEIKVRNADGEVVKTYKLNDIKKGENKITWNGQDERGTNLPDGNYQFFIEAKNANGSKIAVKTDFDGLITGVSYSAEGPILHVGSQSVRMRDVKKITDPSLMKNDQKINNVTAQDLKTNDAVSETESNSNVAPNATQSESTPQVKSKIMDQVGFSRDMINKLAKETR